MKDTNLKSQDKLREKVDGFSLNNNPNKKTELSYITTDQGVYFPPDEEVKKD